MREAAFKANGDLPWRPVVVQMLGNPSSKLWALRKETALRPPRPAPGARLDVGRPIPLLAAVAANLAAYGRSSSAKAPGYLPNCQSSAFPSGDFLALVILQR